MLSGREKEFYEAVTHYTKRGMKPTYKEVVSLLPKPESRYWRQVSLKLEHTGYIERNGKHYAVQAVRLDDVDRFILHGMSLDDLVSKSNIIYFIINGVTTTEKSIGPAIEALLMEVQLDEIQLRLAELWFILTFITDPFEIPRRALRERGVTWDEFRNLVVDTVKGQGKVDE